MKVHCLKSFLLLSLMATPTVNGEEHQGKMLVRRRHLNGDEEPVPLEPKPEDDPKSLNNKPSEHDKPEAVPPEPNPEDDLKPLNNKPSEHAMPEAVPPEPNPEEDPKPLNNKPSEHAKPEASAKKEGDPVPQPEKTDEEPENLEEGAKKAPKEPEEP